MAAYGLLIATLMLGECSLTVMLAGKTAQEKCKNNIYPYGFSRLNNDAKIILSTALIVNMWGNLCFQTWNTVLCESGRAHVQLEYFGLFYDEPPINLKLYLCPVSGWCGTHNLFYYNSFPTCSNRFCHFVLGCPQRLTCRLFPVLNDLVRHVSHTRANQSRI